jgi:hypothetical protein
MPCPYVYPIIRPFQNPDDSVYMVRHDDTCIQFYVREMRRDVMPAPFSDLSCLAQPHAAVRHLAE